MQITVSYTAIPLNFESIISIIERGVFMAPPCGNNQSIKAWKKSFSTLMTPSKSVINKTLVFFVHFKIKKFFLNVSGIYSQYAFLLQKNFPFPQYQCCCMSELSQVTKSHLKGDNDIKFSIN